MPVRIGEAVWKGDLKKGSGSLKVESGTFEADYNFASRFETGSKTNPEELIGAAHAACFSMALSNELASAGHDPHSVETKAEVTLDLSGDDPEITHIKLVSEAHVPGIDKDTFMEIANGAKEGCPVSKVLAGAKITLDIELKS
ncbi:OsmC family protein [Rhodohalobacter sp. 8-1]|uniref:OsmC family protein n=1 Tax=Rhodohalobacter sp. 8-1 TaxID=3131972 RepID=UPI0030EBF8B3